MAFKLSKAEDTRKDQLEGEFNELFGAAEDAKDELKEKITDLIREFNEKIVQPFNEKIGEARGFIEDIQNERQEEFDEKSERWQEGERGEAAQEWIQAWESAACEVEDVSDIEVPELDIEFPDVESVLQDLPFEMSA